MNDEDRYQRLFDDVLLSKHEVAKFLRVSPSKVYAMMRKGEIPYYKVGRKVLFSLQEIREWLKQFRRGGMPQEEVKEEGEG